MRCFGSPQEALARQERLPSGFPVGEAERDTWITATADLGRRCEQRDAALLRYVSTADTARDLDRLRQALGDLRLGHLRIPYGTFLGATYANLFPLFPATVRAMVRHRHRALRPGLRRPRQRPPPERLLRNRAAHGPAVVPRFRLEEGLQEEP
ncbi:hypothetical protein ACFU5O_25250 [Streptomyces sp. NPDC057445]|uniref:hypothetical protein n=1 Tax=Streptomyces sp. NPDC057445 TaxID=3346136 RepID=UPI00368D2233